MATAQDTNNALATPEKVANLNKVFKNDFRVINRKISGKKRTLTGIFRLNHSVLGGTDVLQGDREDLPTEEYIWNDNNTFLEIFNTSTDFVTGTWVFDYSANTITTSDSTLISKSFAKDESKIYTQVEVRTTNAPANLLANYQLQINDGTVDNDIDWNTDSVFTLANGTDELFFKIVNKASGAELVMPVTMPVTFGTSSTDVFDMFDGKGRPIIMEIKYK